MFGMPCQPASLVLDCALEACSGSCQVDIESVRLKKVFRTFDKRGKGLVLIYPTAIARFDAALTVKRS